MLSAHQQQMIQLDELANPITYRWSLSGPFGITSQVITVDAPGFIDQLEASMLFGVRLWRDFIATAITRRVTVDVIEMVRWRYTPLPIVIPSAGFAGKSGLPTARVENTAQVVLHTWHADPQARNRFPLPGMPATWATNQQLNDSGMAEIYKWASILVMGLGVGVGGSPFRWLVAYPDAVESTLANLRGVAFRTVEGLRILSYCDKPPDSIPIDWP